jgi:predicted XRE-type DNA-binding protein
MEIAKVRNNRIDTKSRHVTKPGVNNFSELGFSAKEAAALKAESQRRIDAKLALKHQMMAELEQWANDKGLKQAEVAATLGITRPRVSDVLNKKAAKFSIDMLIDLLGRAGRHVELSFGPNMPQASKKFAHDSRRKGKYVSSADVLEGLKTKLANARAGSKSRD